MKITVDNSLLASLAHCSMQAWLRYGMGYTSLEEHATLLSGSAAHSAVALHLGGKSERVALAAFESSYREFADENVSSDDRLAFGNLRAILRRYLKKNPVGKLPFRVLPETIETEFRLPLAPGIVFAGRIDFAASEWEDPEDVFPVDTKTTGRVNEFFKERYWSDSQLSGYMWALSQLRGRRVRHGYINAIEFSRLPSAPNRKCRDHATTYAECGRLHARFEILGPYDRSERQLEEWRKNAILLTDAFLDLVTRFPTIEYARKLPKEGEFNGHCSFCFAKAFCRAGRKQEHVRSMLRYEPWEVTAT